MQINIQSEWVDDLMMTTMDGVCSVFTHCAHIWCINVSNIIIFIVFWIFCRLFFVMNLCSMDGWMGVCVWACVCKMRDDANERTNERKYQRTNEGRKERYSFVICIICYVCLLECLPNLNRGCVSVSSKMRPKYCRKLAMRLSNCM